MPEPAETSNVAARGLVIIEFGISTVTQAGKVIGTATLSRCSLPLLTAFGRAIVHTLASFILVIYFDGLTLTFLVLAEVDVVDAAQESPFPLNFAFGEVQSIQGPRQAVGAVGETGILSSHPRMFETLLDCDPLVNIHGQHLVNEIQRRVSHGVPVWRWIVESAHFDLLGQGVWIFRGVELIGEGGESAETDVEDYSERPDIHRSRVFPTTSLLQNLGSDVCEPMLLAAIFRKWRSMVNLQLGVPHLSRCSQYNLPLFRGQTGQTYNVVVNESSPIILARPKSANLTVIF